MFKQWFLPPCQSMSWFAVKLGSTYISFRYFDKAMRWFENRHTTSQLRNGTPWRGMGGIWQHLVSTHVFGCSWCFLSVVAAKVHCIGRQGEHVSIIILWDLLQASHIVLGCHELVTKISQKSRTSFTSPSAIQVTHPSTKRPIAVRWNARTSRGSRHYLKLMVVMPTISEDLLWFLDFSGSSLQTQSFQPQPHQRRNVSIVVTPGNRFCVIVPPTWASGLLYSVVECSMHHLLCCLA